MRPFKLSNTLRKRKGSEKGDEFLSEALKSVLKIAAAVLAPTTALAALLYYFGWAYTKAVYKVFGIELSTLNFSNQDYILRSIEVSFDALQTMLLLALACIWIHLLIRKFIATIKTKNKHHLPTIMGLIFILLGLGLALTVGAGYFFIGNSKEADWLEQPFTFTLGFTLVGYGLYLWESGEEKGKRNNQKAGNTSDLSKGRKLSMAVVIGLIVVGLFWLSGNYAHLLGIYRVEDIGIQIKYMPRITIYSQKPLCLEMPGITMVPVSAEPEAFRYRYTGLRFLIRSGGKYFLLPDQWTPSNGNAIILSESEAIRIELSPGDQNN